MKKPVTKKELEKLKEQSIPILFVDIRSPQEYEREHIPGSINVPVNELNNHISHFHKDDTIVCICNHGKERSQAANEILSDAGIENACYLIGGVNGWFLGQE